MTFVYIYNALQLTNAAWMNFLVEGLGFTAWMIGLVSIVGSIMSWFGIMTYEHFFFGYQLAHCVLLVHDSGGYHYHWTSYFGVGVESTLGHS